MAGGLTPSHAPGHPLQHGFTVLSGGPTSPPASPPCQRTGTNSKLGCLSSCEHGWDSSSASLSATEHCGHQQACPIHALVLVQHPAHVPKPPGQPPETGYGVLLARTILGVFRCPEPPFQQEWGWAWHAFTARYILSAFRPSGGSFTVPVARKQGAPSDMPSSTATGGSDMSNGSSS